MQMEPSAVIKRDRIIINIVPIIIAIILLIIICSTVSDDVLIDFSIGVSLCGTMSCVFSTCLGFMITAVSVLMALGKNKYIEILKETGHYKTILVSFLSCCFHTLLALGITVLIMLAQIWSIFAFALLCVSALDVLIIVGISLYFLTCIIVKTS